ncbi:MAG: hypothetical protein LBT20_07550 [Clostridiales bacterium]|jgi:methyl-accepting chemotaxis protein|nr:hypothetical protein [Clostridiales bacterium]
MNEEVKSLIDAFLKYRELLTPVQAGLNEFADSFSAVRENVEKLDAAYGGNIKESMDKLSKTLSEQSTRASDLSGRIDGFTAAANKYIAEVVRLYTVMSKTADKVTNVVALETKAEEQIGRLDALIDEKTKSYNIKELEKSLDSYNKEVQKIGDFINRDVAESLKNTQNKIEGIRVGLEELMKLQKTEGKSLDTIAESYSTTSSLLKNIVEKDGVNEAYIYDVLDKWAMERRVKTKK